jgi:hypothetical protein
VGIYIDHLLRECEKKGKYQQCARCTEAIGQDYDVHIKLKECHEAKPRTTRCPLCHMNIPDGDEPWRDHLTGPDGCMKNPRRIQALKKSSISIRKSRFSQTEMILFVGKFPQKSVVVPASQVNVMKKPNSTNPKKVPTTVK